MKLLIIGGTRFLGRALVDEARKAGHEITLFNRGQSNPGLFPEIEQIHGDRDGGLDSLRRRTWDAVVDTCGYIPRIVRSSAEVLSNSVEHYTFISSISAYADPPFAGMDENAPLGKMSDDTIEEITGETYGPLKALCEQATTESMNGRALLVRSGLIVGPHDPTDRFTYWPARIAQGGQILAPGEPGQPVQFIDVRDIARWIILATENRLTGPYNVTGPASTLSMQGLLNACVQVTGSLASFTWVDENFLLANEVAPFTEMPLWLPVADTGISHVSIARALAAGLSFRPLPDTIRDTLAWAASRPADYEPRNGLSPEREAALLAMWPTS